MISETKYHLFLVQPILPTSIFHLLLTDTSYCLIILTSVLLFCFLPSSVSFDTIGCEAP